MVVELQGKVGDLQLFDVVNAGRQLQLPADTRVTLSFLQAGRRARCQGPAVFAIEATGARKLSGPGSVTTQQPAATVAREIPGSFNWDKMAGVRHREVGWLVDDALLHPEAVLRWQLDPLMNEVEVVVESLPDYQRVYKQTVPANQREVKVSLEAGRSYELSLTGFPAGGAPTEPAKRRVRVLATDHAARLLAWEKAATQREELMEMCGVWLQYGVRSRASLLAQQLIRHYPDSARLRELAEPIN